MDEEGEDSELRSQLQRLLLRRARAAAAARSQRLLEEGGKIRRLNDEAWNTVCEDETQGVKETLQREAASFGAALQVRRT